jgi:hypothetical protein
MGIRARVLADTRARAHGADMRAAIDAMPVRTHASRGQMADMRIRAGMLADACARAHRADMRPAINAMAAHARAARGQVADMRACANAMGADMGADTDAQHIDTQFGGVRAARQKRQGQGRNQNPVHDNLPQAAEAKMRLLLCIGETARSRLGSLSDLIQRRHEQGFAGGHELLHGGRGDRLDRFFRARFFAAFLTGFFAVFLTAVFFTGFFARLTGFLVLVFLALAFWPLVFLAVTFLALAAALAFFLFVLAMMFSNADCACHDAAQAQACAAFKAN